MSLANVLNEMDIAMIPFNKKIKEEKYKEMHSMATKKGMEAWLIYRKIWLKKLESFPENFPTYKDKISHISKLWKIGNKSIRERHGVKSEYLKNKMLEIKNRI
tara:strand:- start:693 stop:1001 length:309 start_codon:yes stop_codon:yes gene_type:complete